MAFAGSEIAAGFFMSLLKKYYHMPPCCRCNMIWWVYVYESEETGYEESICSKWELHYSTGWQSNDIILFCLKGRR